MKKWITFLVLLMMTACATEPEIEVQQPIILDEFISADTYLTIHPEQVAISEAFAEIVEGETRKALKAVDKNLSIAVVYPGTQTSDYWRRSVDSFKKRMDELGLSYTIDEHFTKAGTEIALQEDAIKEAIAKKPDYLVFTLDAKSHQRIIEQILDEGSTKLILQNITTPYSNWEGNQPFLYVGFDHKTGTEILARDFISRFDGKGQYGLLYFTKGFISEVRGDTFIDYMNENSDFELVSSYYTDGDREKSKSATLDLIDLYPDIEFIYACSTDVALGAIDALKEKGLVDEIVVNGWGGGSSELEAIMNKELELTVMRMNDDNGVAMAEAIYMDNTGESDMIPTIYSGAFELVDESTSISEIEAFINKAFRYSGE